MVVIVRDTIDEATLKGVTADLDGYIKVVVDIEREILAAGGKRHVDGETLLLKDGSKQGDLWGGGLDTETGEVDFDSMINIRPSQGNMSREVLSSEIRQRMEDLIHKLLQ